MNEAERIESLERELKKCKEAPWNSLSLLSAIVGASAISYYFIIESQLSFLIGGVIGLTIGLSVWTKLRIVYKQLSMVYEAEIAAVKKKQ